MSSNRGGGIVSSMITWTSEKLSSLIPSSILPSSSNEPQSNTSLEDLKKLERTMKRIQAIAVDAEKRGVKDQVEKLRLEELKEVAYDAEDVVDDYEFEVLSAKIKAGIHLGGNCHKPKSEDKVNHVTLSHLIVPVPSELAIRVKGVRERFDEIIREWEVLCWSEGESLRQYGVDMVKPPQSTSLVHDPSIHGRNKDKENIVKLLISGDSNCDSVGSLSVLSLLGMGGIGKTTLAQLVYNDKRVCKYFQLRAWVCVSENFSVEILTKNIIVSLTKRTCDFTELDVLQRILLDEVKGKKILIVLDDVWNEESSLWHLLKTPLTGTCFGKIVVTTRNENVARNMQTMPPYVLTNLPFEYCWSLFKQLAFERQNSNPGLLEIGREIVTKCGGLPLAVKALGSLLRFEVEEVNWRGILDSEIWELEMRNNDVLPALKISYDRLPVNLKQCFVLLSLFPKEKIIFEDKIVRLWLSLGFVLPEGRKSLEDIAVGYVTELLQRSMIQLAAGEQRGRPMRSVGKERRFIMHDLVNDLAQLVSGNTFSRIDPNMLHELPGESRYISIVPNKQTDITNLQYLNHLKAPRFVQVVDIIHNRGIYLPTKYRFAMIPPELFEMLKHLRALDLSYSDIYILPDSIGNLRQLRYLDIRSTKVGKLPDSICGLYNLQILELQYSFIEELPDRISSLVNLQHLTLNSGTCIPHGIGQLLNLKTLPYFTVRPGTWHCELSELRNLVNLKEKLCINGLKHVTTVKDAEEASLYNKRYLKELTLDWDILLLEFSECHHSDQGSCDNDKLSEQLLGVLQPPANIEKLTILNYVGSSYPTWLGDASFSKLVELTLDGSYYISVKSLPTLGQLPSLISLSITWMLRIENVGREFCSHDSKIVGFSFRSLEMLEFDMMPDWVNWSGVENGEFSSLRNLSFLNCSKLQFIPQPLCSSLTTLEVDNCRNLTTPHLLPSLNCLIMRENISEVFFDYLYLPLLRTLELEYVSSTSLVLTSHNLPSIEVIEITGCRKLISVVGLSSLNSLKELQIWDCPFLQFASDECLPHGLQRLGIYGCPQLDEWKQLQLNRN
ncbi:hypothetical protein LUZ60_005393 [Juncus effusus]|nr:hypothetical protein LUZ60_005393 [Juncus effusus]